MSDVHLRVHNHVPHRTIILNKNWNISDFHREPYKQLFQHLSNVHIFSCKCTSKKIKFCKIWPANCLLGSCSVCAILIGARLTVETTVLAKTKNDFFLTDRTRWRSSDGDADVQRARRRTVLLPIRRFSKGVAPTSRRHCGCSRFRRYRCSERVAGGHGKQKSERTPDESVDESDEDSPTPFLTSIFGTTAVGKIA